MWDTTQDETSHLSHDLPCPECGHGAHTYLPCSESCDCARSFLPGTTHAVLAA